VDQGSTPAAPNAPTTAAETRQVCGTRSWLSCAPLVDNCDASCCNGLDAGVAARDKRARSAATVSGTHPHMPCNIPPSLYQPPCALSTSLPVAGGGGCVTDRISVFCPPMADEMATPGSKQEARDSCRQWVRLV
jgi:hypothetical protein